jgi:hypothetical protein
MTKTSTTAKESLRTLLSQAPEIIEMWVNETGHFGVLAWLAKYPPDNVSPAARRCYLEHHEIIEPYYGGRLPMFTSLPGGQGYKMTAWESQISMARAMGRGDASGRKRPAHRFDRKPQLEVAA